VHIRVNYRQPRGFDVGSICLDSTAWQRAAGWTPKVSLEEGIRRVARFFGSSVLRVDTRKSISRSEIL
jgi:nucleoside-diphosphate-sugar epimerase